eukprot:2959865-Pyramimonas_sp.AAC.1
MRARCYLRERLPAHGYTRWAVWGGRGWSRWWCQLSLVVLAGPGWTPQRDIAGTRARYRPPPPSEARPRAFAPARGSQPAAARGEQ